MRASETTSCGTHETTATPPPMPWFQLSSAVPIPDHVELTRPSLGCTTADALGRGHLLQRRSPRCCSEPFPTPMATTAVLQYVSSAHEARLCVPTKTATTDQCRSEPLSLTLPQSLFFLLVLCRTRMGGGHYDGFVLVLSLLIYFLSLAITIIGFGFQIHKL